MVKKIITNRNLRQNAYKSIRDYIVSNEVPPGAKINEDELAKNLGVSKTPVREALSKLAHDGIVEIIPNRGAFKIKLSKADLSEILMIRETLEGLSFRLAIPNINDKEIKKLKALLDEFDENDLEKSYTRYPESHLKFHTLLHQLSKSPRLIRIIQSMFDLINMVRLQYFSNIENVRHSLKFHKELIDALEKKDAELAVNIRKNMLRATYETLLELAQ
jgi:DNA-binding GntR family transcriptional regulator